jgi:transposase
MSTHGMVATMTIEEPTDTDILLAYIVHILYPVPKPGHIVVMDNLGAHKAPAVRLWIEKAGAELLYLPPCSPDLNPIENASPSSNKCSARPRCEPRKFSIRPLRKLCRQIVNF